MTNDSVEPTLHFFHTPPDDPVSFPSFCSSLQKFETTFFLVAFNRFPAALVACASAIESGLKGALGKGPEDRMLFRDLVGEAGQRSKAIAAVPANNLRTFRDARNRLDHYGFSPADDALSVDLLLAVGIPFLDLCYREFFSLHLQDALIPNIALQVRIATEVHRRARVMANLDVSYCVHVLGHLVRWMFRESVSWQLDAEQRAEEFGAKHAVCADLKSNFERVFEPCWSFDCPVCGESDSFVCAFDPDSLVAHQECLSGGACVNCELHINTGWPFLADVLFRDELRQAHAVIVKEYGLKQ